MNVDKTIEEKRKSVLAYCEEVCPDTYKCRVVYDRFVVIWRKLKWNLEPYFEVVIGNNTLTVDDTFTHWHFLYAALGLEARDAVEAARLDRRKEFMEQVDAKLSVIAARNAALVAALEEIRNICTEVDEHPDYTFAEDDAKLFIGICDRALTTNTEKGGVQG